MKFSDGKLNMGRRRRKKEIRIIKKRIPKIFSCPSCGTESVLIYIDKNKKTSRVACGSCGLTWNTSIKDYEEPVDVYSRFVDAFLNGSIKEESHGES